MKRFFFLIMLFSITIIHCQTHDDINKLPTILPVSPEATSLGQYGDIPVNLASGRINHSIPLYTIKVGEFSFPIGLSYNYSGLIAEADPSSVGMGWSLNATGVVTRQVNGKPDENGYVGLNVGLIHVVPFHESEMTVNEQLNLYEYSSLGIIDTEPDRFIYNIFGLSGDFYLNEYGTPVLLPLKNYQITIHDISTGISQISLIDDKGVVYICSYKEDTTSETISDGSSSDPINYISSWFIEKIILPNSKEILFEYDTYFHQKETHSTIDQEITIINGNPPTPYSGDVITMTDIDAKIVSKIIFPDGEIIFNNSIIDAGNSDNGGGGVLNSMIVKNSIGDVINNYVFEYSNNIPDNRKLLKRIFKIKDETNSILYYEFDYFGDIPNIINYASQDIYGYYNGAYNTLLLNGNRKSNYSTTLLGALKKIIYPTKGYSNITYELNTIATENGNNYSPFSGMNCSEIALGSTITSEANAENDTISKNKVFYNFDNGNLIKVTMEVEVDTLFLGDEMIVELIDTEGILVDIDLEEDLGILVDCPDHISGQNTLGPIWAQGEGIKYKKVVSFYRIEGIEPNEPRTVTLQAIANCPNSNSTGFAKISIDFLLTDPHPPVLIETPIAGLRVKTIESCSGSNNCNEKEFVYIQNVSDAVLINKKHVYSRSTHYQPLCSPNADSNTCLDYIVTTRFLQSNIPMVSFGNPVLYKRVTIYEGNIGQNTSNKTVKYFTGEEPSYDMGLTHYNKKNWKTGLLEKNEVYKKGESSYTKIHETINKFSTFRPYTRSVAINNNKISLGFKSTRIYHKPIREFTDFIFDDPYYLPEFHHLTQTKKINYIDGEKRDSIISNYTYDTFKGYLKHTETTTSDESVVNKSDYYYPTDKDQLTDLSTNSLNAIDELINQNRIENPIQTETYKNNELLSTQRSNYKDWGQNATGTANIILPETIETAKGGEDLEPRITYHKYDTHGNPLEVSKADNPKHICYIWGYNHSKPIAKIENATYSDIEALASFGTDFEITEYFSNTQENQLRSLLPNAMVTTYEYIPLVGVKTITQPNGETTYYEYDNFNRLKLVKDSNGNILKENEYHYKD